YRADPDRRSYFLAPRLRWRRLLSRRSNGIRATSIGPMPCMIVRISFCSNSVIMPTARCHLKRPVFVSFRVQNRSQECSIRCYIRGQRMSKIIHENWIQGQRGVNFVERVVLDMGFTWEATRVDVGVDGQIEIRDPTTGAMKNWILRAQVKERQS